jgi:hypothetical protein
MENLSNLIMDAITKGIKRNAERIFDISQNTEGCYVPVDTGFLKQSGGVEPLSNGASIRYRADYAAEVEFGTKGEPWSGSQDVRVRTHKRNAYTRKDGTYVSSHNVKGHNKHYENQRLIAFRPKNGKGRSSENIYRVVSGNGATEGQFFLTRAVQEGIGFLATDMELYLKRLEQL